MSNLKVIIHPRLFSVKDDNITCTPTVNKPYSAVWFVWFQSEEGGQWRAG